MDILSFLKQKNINYEDLTPQEKETLKNWYKTLAENKLTLEKVKEYIASMKNSVETELADYNLPKEKDLLLKARLKNYIMLYEFMTLPEKAKKYLEQSLNNLNK